MEEKMEAQIKEGALYRERKEGVKFQRIIRVRKIAKMGPLTYVFFMAENQVAQSAHPNGGFIPLDSFFDLWAPLDSKDSKYSGGNGQA
jgi:hypothetical protein